MLRTVRNILNYKTAIKKEFHYDETGTFVVGSHDIWFNADEIISVLHVRKAQEKNSDVSYVSQDIYYSLYLIVFSNGDKEYICVPSEEDFICKVWPEVTR